MNDQLTDPAAHQLSPQRPSLRWRFVVLFVLALFGSYIAIITPSVVSLALRVQQIDPNGKVGSLSLVLSIGALCAIIANPLFGKLSDRTTTRFGMRRPWMIVGLVGGILGLALVATAHDITMVLVGWCVTQAMFNALLSTLVALLPDQIPAAQRGVIGGLMGICYPAGVIVGGWVSGALANSSQFWMIMAPTTPAIVLVGLLCITLKDRRLDPRDRPAWSLREFVRTFWFNPRRSPDFAWTLLAVFLTGTALMTFSTYQVYYLSDRIGIDAAKVPGVAAQVTALVFGCSIATALLSGWMADRLQRSRFFFVVAGVVMAAGLVIVIFAFSLAGLYVGAAVIGLGTGFYFCGHYALPAATLPSEQDAAKDMGIANIAVTIPSSLVPVYGPFLLGLGGAHNDNYLALFISGAAAALFAVPAIRRVRNVA